MNRSAYLRPRQRRASHPMPAHGPGIGTSPVAPGETGPAQPDALPMPHERDESLGAVEDTPDSVIRQAKEDIDAGKVDTDMRSTPGLDAQRRKKLIDPGR